MGNGLTERLRAVGLVEPFSLTSADDPYFLRQWEQTTRDLVDGIVDTSFVEPMCRAVFERWRSVIECLTAPQSIAAYQENKRTALAALEGSQLSKEDNFWFRCLLAETIFSGLEIEWVETGVSPD